MNKKQIVGFIVLIVIMVGYFLFEQSKKTTYEEVIANLIDEDEKVEQITVYSQIPLVMKTASATINDEKLINKIINEQIKLKKINTMKLPVIMTTLVIKTDKDSYEIGFDGNSIMIGSVRYSTTNPSINPIYMLVNQDLNWEIIEYTPFIWR
ncbi:hypothetical protein [Bacillus sp. S/N-304-OC-R1]|uniref:hypothetical protein n=1 Tax=Bacillus sp. S/N-304-OC-R1 TaxID=2758034 RepID=UPI001C8D2589|nr:hypothetical protein [Bacillus sp. S/N-304-OC-R1]MBY0121571.1 hypothetical protein [Bacillus sp. S/N-304-OC-R1]